MLEGAGLLVWIRLETEAAGTGVLVGNNKNGIEKILYLVCLPY
jgi:hypothetical protein